MTTLVTGGAGMLGSELVRQLLERGDERPVVIDIAESPQRLEGLLDRIEYVQASVGDAQAMQSVIERCKPEKIYHLGAMLGIACEENPVAAAEVNAMGFVHLMESARQHGVSQVLFASSITTFGEDLEGGTIGDNSLQRPSTFYGITKLFDEGVGRYYRQQHGLDFRAIRFPSITGPGLREGGIVNYTSAMIEQAIRGEPCNVIVAPDTQTPLVHVIDAAGALIDLAAAPAKNIRSVCYLVDGVLPRPSAGDMAKMVRTRLPDAKIDFQVEERWRPLIEKIAVPIDDTPARKEWGWQPIFDYARIIEDFVDKLGSNSQRDRFLR